MDELIDALRKSACVSTTWGDLLGVAADTIEELISRVPKWISVKDVLPPSNELVIVSIYDTHGDTAFRYSSTGWLTSDTKVWVVDDEENSGVTHWMELPEMPKGE